MADRLTPSQRSNLMSHVKGKNTKPEKLVRSLLHKMGYRFRLHRKDLPGSPDIVLPKYHTVIFVHGCFWHHHQGCKKATMPENNAEFWKTKMVQNTERDQRKIRNLLDLGWAVIIVWQCEAESRNIEQLKCRLNALLQGSDASHLS